jgi:hypothetical protein
VDDAATMGRVQRVCDLAAPLQNPVDRKSLSGNGGLQRPPLQQLHGNELPGVVLADVVYRADVGMI